MLWTPARCNVDGLEAAAPALALPPLAELLAFVRELHEQQPQRTAPVLGQDGAPEAYIKRRFAADFKDNPAGDRLDSFLVCDRVRH